MQLKPVCLRSVFKFEIWNIITNSVVLGEDFMSYIFVFIVLFSLISKIIIFLPEGPV